MADVAGSLRILCVWGQRLTERPGARVTSVSHWRALRYAVRLCDTKTAIYHFYY
jgi:hypothetical protein